MEEQDPVSVQSTNDDSIISKRSAARFSYISDDFLRYFVSKPPRRSPLINRGYYIRCKLIRDGLGHFLDLPTNFKEKKQKKQIISLGAGFDTSYWVLKQSNHFDLDKGHHYYEIDFPGVVSRKSRQIRENAALLDLIGKPSESESGVDIEIDEIHTMSYTLLKGDLRNLEDVQTKLRKTGLDFKSPVLFLAECVMTYMKPEDSDRIIKWAATTFEHVVFFTYEQIIPWDTFGTVMTTTLSNRKSPLLGIHKYPSLQTQNQRYIDLGFHSSKAATLLECYEGVLPKEEVARVEHLEEFDEFEEWVIKCQHYFIAIAIKGDTPDCPFSYLYERMFPPQEIPIPLHAHYTGLPPEGLHLLNSYGMKWEMNIRNESPPQQNKGALQRYGHTVTYHQVQGLHCLVLFGGYGGHKGHHRLDDLYIFHVDTFEWQSPKTSGPGPCARMYHSAVAATPETMVLFGGRAGPRKPFNNFYTLSLTNMTWEHWNPSGDIIAPRWRHTANVIGHTMIIFGGRGVSNEMNHFVAFGDTYLVNLHTRHVTLLHTTTPTPAPRFSHTAIVYQDQLFLFGGMNSNNQYFNDLYTLDIQNRKWLKIETSGDIPSPRFSHTANLIFLERETPKKEIPFMVILGGCSPLTTKNEQHFLNLETLTWETSYIPFPKIPIPPMFVRHVAVGLTNQKPDRLFLIGGGALCFSFGSFFNDMHMLRIFIPNLEIPEFPKIPPQLAGAGTKLVLAESGEIPILEKPIEGEFWEKIYPSRMPVILRGLDLGRCTELWTNLDYLKKTCSKKVSVRQFHQDNLDFLNKNYQFTVMPFSEMMDAIFTPKMYENDTRFYFRSTGENPRKEVSDIKKFCLELAKDFQLPPEMETVGRRLFSSVLRMSSAGIRMWTHYDVMDNILCQVVGQKQIILWPPSEVSNLYVVGSTSSVVDILSPRLDLYPKFAKAKCLKGILNPGDVLFIPSLWFHNTYTNNPSISVNIFWKHLPDEEYSKKDLYGNHDPVVAEQAMNDLSTIMDQLTRLPSHYSDFYMRKMIDMLKSRIHDK